MATPPNAVPNAVPPGQPKKIGPLVWILGGCGAIVFLGLVAFIITTYFIASKVKEVAKGNPASIVKMIAAMNPDVEVVSTNDSDGTVTVRNKKDGKVVTMNFDDIKNGHITFEQDGKKTEITTGANGAGGIKINSSDGSMVLGGSEVKYPSWVPAYPGSKAQGVLASNNGNETGGMVNFTTSDSVAKVSQHYNDTLKAAGFTVESAINTAEASVLSAKDHNRTVTVTIGKQDSETTVAVAYAEKK